MNSPKLDNLIAGGREALKGFLQTLLGQNDIPFETATPSESTPEAIRGEETQMLSLVAATPPFVIQMVPGWLPVLSRAMLGEAINVGDEGYEDLARELAGQAFGAVRTQLASAGLALGDVTFEVIPPGEPLPDLDLPERLVVIPFSMTHGEAPLTGRVICPYTPDLEEAPMPASQAAAAQAAAPGAAPSSGAPVAGQGVPVAPLTFPDLGREALGHEEHSFGLLADVELEVTVELGRRRMPLADILRLTNGSVIELEKLVGEPLDIYANGRFIAEGEAVVIDEQFGIRITRLASTKNRERVYH